MAALGTLDSSAEAGRAFQTLEGFGRVLAVKLYRLAPATLPVVPVLPCLDHEAMLHEGIAPHAAVYVQEAESGDLHELVFVPEARRIELDTVSTWGENLIDSLWPSPSTPKVSRLS